MEEDGGGDDDKGATTDCCCCSPPTVVDDEDDAGGEEELDNDMLMVQYCVTSYESAQVLEVKHTNNLLYRFFQVKPIYISIPPGSSSLSIRLTRSDISGHNPPHRALRAAL